VKYMYHIFFIHFPIDVHLDWCYNLALVNSATMNMGARWVNKDAANTQSHKD
jgi:hypothetical protein